MTQLSNPQNSVGIITKDNISSLPNVSSKELSIYNNDTNLVKFKDYNTQKELALMTALLVKWCNYLGIEPPDSQELNNTCNFIKEHFENFNHQDLDNTIMMIVTSSLDTDAQHYGKLSIIYVHKCLKAYMIYKGSVLIKIRQQLDKIESSKKIEISPEVRVENMKKLIVYAINDVINEEKVFLDYGDALYNFIKANRLISMTDQLIKDAMLYGETSLKDENKKMVMEAVIKHHNFKSAGDMSFEKEDKIKKYARQYVVNEWLKNVDVEDLLKKITPEMFKY
jgi:hypothetical protein